MAARKPCSEDLNEVVVLNQSTSHRDCIEAHVGTTSQWELGKSDYPDFYLQFRGANPFDDQENAIFRGSLEKQLTLVYKNPGTFEFDVIHLQKEEAEFRRGPFCMVICPLPIVRYKPPVGCPPYC